MKKYFGITIGPVFHTVNMTSKPGALWLASYLFSSLSKALCSGFVEAGVNEKAIIAPYFSTSDELFAQNNGIGLFHDRIIIDADAAGVDPAGIFADVKDQAIKDIAALFQLDNSIEYLQNYLMIKGFAFETDANPLIESGKILDCAELSYFPPAEEANGENGLLALLLSKNGNLANAPAASGLEGFQLRKENGNGFKDLLDITRTRADNFKKYKYYAIVRSDGDNMSAILRSLDTTEKIREYSRNCLEYCSEIAQAVGAFGGVTIYAGGDDLLAILPCENADGQTVFDFIGTADGIFHRHFDRFGMPASLSFGVTIAYNKFPLYEALEDSADLLFGVAKRSDVDYLLDYIKSFRDANTQTVMITKERRGEIDRRLCALFGDEKAAELLRSMPQNEISDDGLAAWKNKLDSAAVHSTKDHIAVRVQKHSGQSQGLLISKAPRTDINGTKFAPFCDLLASVRGAAADENVLLSVMHKIALFADHFDAATDGATIDNLYLNFFDSNAQIGSFLNGTLPEYHKFLVGQYGILPFDESGVMFTSPSQTINHTLRIIKFFLEKGN